MVRHGGWGPSGPSAGSSGQRGVAVGGVASPAVLFDVVTTEVGAWSVVSVTGELDVATAPRLRQEVHRLTGGGHVRLVLDLSGVEFLDSTGLGVVVGALKRVRTHGGALRVVAPPEHVRRVLELTRLDQILALYPDARAAVAAEGDRA